MTARRVLVVDDDANLLRLLALRLEKEGFDVAEAASAEAALAALATRQHGVVARRQALGFGLTARPIDRLAIAPRSSSSTEGCTRWRARCVPSSRM